MSVTRKGFYGLRDLLTLEEARSMGIEKSAAWSTGRFGSTGRHVLARWTGEKRPPKRGEWYLSGAIVEAYRAKSDMTGDWLIAELVLTETVQVVRAVST